MRPAPIAIADDRQPLVVAGSGDDPARRPIETTIEVADAGRKRKPTCAGLSPVIVWM